MVNNRIKSKSHKIKAVKDKEFHGNICRKVLELNTEIKKNSIYSNVNKKSFESSFELLNANYKIS